MPQLKTKNPTKPQVSSSVTAAVILHPTLTDACDLIGIMLDYEATARANDVDLASGRFAMLTASERQMLRAELIADYIQVSSSNMGDTPDAFESALQSFCSKVCDMRLPSHELIGTYLATVDVVNKTERLSQMAGLIEAVRRTMITVLQSCVEQMRVKAEGQGIGTGE